MAALGVACDPSCWQIVEIGLREVKMFGLGKNKDEKFKEDFTKRLVTSGKQIDAALSAQLQFAVDKFDADLSEVWEDAYTRYYIFGAYDSLTCDLPIEVRKKIAPTIIEMGFHQFARPVFELSEQKVAADLKMTFTFQAKHPTYPAIIDGGMDGMEARQGKPALRLLKHLFDTFQNPDY